MTKNIDLHYYNRIQKQIYEIIKRIQTHVNSILITDWQIKGNKSNNPKVSLY